MKADAQGNVISIDMAADRCWADDYQMDQILVFPTLESLVIEGPGITNQLIPRIVKQKESPLVDAEEHAGRRSRELPS